MKRFFILLSISLFALTACVKGDGGAENPKSYTIDARAMDATTLNCAVDEALKLGYTNLAITLTSKSAFDFGYLVYFFEKAVAVSGYMIGVNPFNQPGVESYKKNMFALLDKPGYAEHKAELDKRLADLA